MAQPDGGAEPRKPLPAGAQDAQDPQDALQQAIARLRAGRLVAFPTETVYGLGADARNPAAIAAIFAAKGRPADHPLIVHLATQSDPGDWTSDLPPVAVRLIEQFWPGPLTLILKRATGVPAAVAGGQDSIGLRCPDHPLAQALLQGFCASHPADWSRGVAAPSANRFGRISPTRAEHVRSEFPDGDVFILDGGACPLGIESTILDLSRLDERHGRPVLLRPGSILPEALAEAIGEVPRGPQVGAAGVPRASGTLAAHYAPRTPMQLLDSAQLETRPLRDDEAVWTYSLSLRGRHWRAAPSEAAAFARTLYASLRELDALGCARILIECPPQTPQWAAVLDRLGRAQTGSGT